MVAEIDAKGEIGATKSAELNVTRERRAITNQQLLLNLRRKQQKELLVYRGFIPK